MTVETIAERSRQVSIFMCIVAFYVLHPFYYIAHVGIALSDSEASVVSPFTSIDKSITSVLDVLKEGRCTLTSAISSYKYMIMYGQIETINQMICAWFSITFSEWCWVFMVGFIQYDQH